MQEPFSEERSSFLFVIKKAAELNMASVLQYQANPRNIEAPSQDMLNALDLLLKAASGLIPVSRSLFDPQSRQRAERSAMYLMKGVYSSARPTQLGLLANVDVTNGLFYPDGPMLNALASHLGLQAPPATLQPYQLNSFLAKFRNVIFSVSHRGQKRGRYRFRGFSRESAESMTFQVDGKTTKMTDYFRDTYGLRLQFSRLPLVEVRTAGPSGERITHFPMEVCVIQPNQRVVGKADETDTAAMVKFASSFPAEREKAVNQSHRQLELGKSQQLQAWGTRVDEKLVEVDARLIPPPKIKYAKKGQPGATVFVEDSQKKGFWQMPNNASFFGTSGIRALAVLCLADTRATTFGGDRERANNITAFCKGLMDAARRAGMRVEQSLIDQGPTAVSYCNTRNEYVEDAMRALRAQVPGPNAGIMFVIVLPRESGNDAEYREAKRAADTMLGLASQCIKPKWIRNMEDERGRQRMPTVFSNIVLKLNPKLGGTNVGLGDRLPMMDQPTMIIGIDVTHPPPGSDAVSIAAVVSSMDREAAQYRAAVHLQDARQEVLEAMDEIVADQLALFRLKNGMYPERIMVFRDGVSEGQFRTVLEHEVKGIKKAAAGISAKLVKEGKPAYDPKVLFVVVQKRHRTRFVVVALSQTCG